MNKFKTSRFLISTFVVTVLIAVLIFLTSSGWFVSAASNLISLADRVVARPFVFLSSQKDGVRDLMTTYKENEALKKSVYNMEEKADQADALKEENKQLRALLDFKEQNPNSIKIASEVINRNPSSWKSDLTVDKGSKEGVADSMLVLGNGGLIGSVTKVSENSSLISLLSNEKNDAKISVKIQTSSGQVYGIITGYNTEKSAFVISQLNSLDGVKEGDSVLTSGLGGYKAENLPVGRVLSISDGKDQLNKEVLVQPAADFSDISAVVLVGN